MGVVFYLLIVLATQWLCLPKRVICVVCLVYFYLKSEMNALDLISNYINDNYNTTLGFRLNFVIT